jgi:hypothetical protein
MVQMNDNDTPPPADKSQRTATRERGPRTSVPRVIPSGGERGKIQAADADRDRTMGMH